MTLKDKRLYFFLGSSLALFVFLFVIAGQVITPFVFASVFSYIFNPLVLLMNRKFKLKRSFASIIIVVGVILVLTSIANLVIPNAVRQTMSLTKDLKHNLKQYSLSPNDQKGFIDEFLQTNVKPYIKQYFLQSDSTSKIEIPEYLDFRVIFQKTLSSGLKAINIIAFIALTPILCFYLLKDWQRTIDKIKSLIPRSYLPSISTIAKDIDTTLRGYILGVFYVMVFLSIFYSTLLLIVGLKYGVLLGFATGIMAIIPYVGISIGMIIGIAIAIMQSDSLFLPIAVLVIFAIGQFIEGNFITPKIIGDKIGIHPVWIIFSLLLCGSLFGFVGLLIAIPMVAIIGCIVRFLLNEYKQGKYYK